MFYFLFNYSPLHQPFHLTTDENYDIILQNTHLLENLMEHIPHILWHTFLDFLKLLPFLFLAYLLMELIEHKAGEKTRKLIRHSGRFGPALGAALGVLPQCGFAAATANLYAGKLLSRGTLIAVFLSTSDEMLPILVSEGAPIGVILKLLGIKLAVGMLVGFVTDLIGSFKKHGHSHRCDHDHVHDLCLDSNCGCGSHSIFRAALTHTVKIGIFILLVTLAVNIFVEFIGEDKLAAFATSVPVLGSLVSGLVGLIPNCAGSVVITELWLNGAIGAGAMLSGLLVSSGLGVLILFRSNKNLKDNLFNLALLYVSGVVLGSLLGLLPIF